MTSGIIPEDQLLLSLGTRAAEVASVPARLRICRHVCSSAKVAQSCCEGRDGAFYVLPST